MRCYSRTLFSWLDVMDSIELSKRYLRLNQVSNLSAVLLAFAVVLFLSLSVSVLPASLEASASGFNEALVDHTGSSPELPCDDCGLVSEFSVSLPATVFGSLYLVAATVFVLLRYFSIQARAPPKITF